MKKKALICGISGQDGTFLAKYLLDKNYQVIGTSRDHLAQPFYNLKQINIHHLLTLASMDLKDFHSVLSIVKEYEPDEIYYLAGQTSVGLSFSQPIETFESITLGVLNLLEASRMIDYKVRIYNASSSECFGDTKGERATEASPFNPKSPYAISKVAAHTLVENYRDAYDLYACNGICFNHESFLRPKRFVTQKIISAVKNISCGSDEELVLGRIDIVRDWGWAPEYIVAMWEMLQQNKPEDYIIASGSSHSLEEFISTAFASKGLDYLDYIRLDSEYIRPNELLISMADPSKINNYLSWKAKMTLQDIIDGMLEQNLNNGAI